MAIRRRLEQSLLFSFALIAWSSRAESQVEGSVSALSLDWSAPAGCPSREHVAEKVEATLGRSKTPRAPLAVRAVATQSPGGKWHVSLEAERQGTLGTRAFDAESCDAAADATALIISLMIDPTAALAAQDTPPAPVPEPVTPPAPPVSPPIEPSPATLTRAHLFALRASLAGDVGTFPSANLGGELALALSLWRLRFELAGSYWASPRATLSGPSPEGASLGLFTVGARAAYVFSGRDLALAPFVGVEGDQMSASGFGGTSQRHQTATWAEIALGATGSWSPIPQLHDVALVLTLEAVVAPESTPAFVATEPAGGDRTVQQPSQVAGRAFFGVEVRFF